MSNSIQHDLRTERSTIQTQRETLAHRRRAKTAVRTLHADLETRVERLERDLEAGSADPVVALERLLDLAAGGDLDHLQEPLRDSVSVLQSEATERLEAMTVDSVAPPSGSYRWNWETRGALPTALASYLYGHSSKSRVRKTVSALLETDDPGRIDALRWYVETHLHPLVATSVDEAVSELRSEKEAHVKTLEQTDDPDVQVDPVTALNWTNPIAMLPVRLETSFVDLAADPKLLVRVYPDQIHVDSHEAALTDDEYEWGTQFWTQLWFACHEMPAPDKLADTPAHDVYDGVEPGADAPRDRLPDDRLRRVAGDLYEQVRADAFSADMADRFNEVRERAWQRGSDRFGAERAAFVVHELSPNDGPSTFGKRVLRDFSTPPWEANTDPDPLHFPTVDRRPASWTEEPTAELLPERWVVYATWADERTSPPANPPTDWQSVGTRSWRRWDDDAGRWVLKVTGPPIREPLAVGPSPEAVAGRDDDADAGMSWMTTFDADDDDGDATDVGMGLSIDLPDDGSFDATVGFEEVVVTGVRTSADAEATAEDLQDLLSGKEYTDGLAFLKDGTPTNNADESAAGDSPSTAAAQAPTKVGQSLTEPDDAALSAAGFHPLDGSTFETAGDRLARALGIAPDRDERHVFGHVYDADSRASENAGHVNETVWPATWGYYAKNMLVPGAWGTVLGGDGEYSRPDPEAGEGHESGGQDERIAEELPGLHLLTWLAAYRNHFRDHVRSEGPLGTLRVGDQPYGVLPVAPVDVESDEPSTGSSRSYGTYTTPSDAAVRHLDPDAIGEGTFLTDLIERVHPLRDVWLDSAGSNLPRVGADRSLNEQDLLDLFSMEADGSTFRRQSWLVGGTNAVWRAFDEDLNAEPDSFFRGNRTLSKRFGREDVGTTLPTVPPSSRIREMRFTGQTGILASPGYVVDDDLHEFVNVLGGLLDDSLYDFGPSSWYAGYGRSGWLQRLRALGGIWRTSIQPKLFATLDPASIVTTSTRAVGAFSYVLPAGVSSDALDADTVGTDALTTVESIARQLLYFAAMREVASSRIRLGALYRDQVEIGPDPSTYLTGETIDEELGDPIEGYGTDPLTTHDGLRSIASPTYEDAIRVAFVEDATPEIDPLAARFDRSRDHLTALEVDRYRDLLMGSLGAASHRLDAWLTSIATRQLWNVREGQSTADEGVHVGAFGYVENLSVDGTDDGEYLLAPSQNQVTSAAMMRSVHSHTADDAHEQTLAVDLSADRVETARSYISAVRSGLSLSEIMGYRFERRLHEANLETHISTFRELAPARAGKIDRETSENPTSDDQSRRSDVVDGLDVYQAWKDDDLPWGDPLPAAGSAAAETIDDVLADFHTAMDAVNDVLTAEAVHQLAKGNPERAAAALEGLSRGKRVPEPEFLETPRQSDGINHRLFVLFGDAGANYDRGEWEPNTTASDLVDPPSDLPELEGYDSPTYEAESDRSTVESPRARDDAEPNLDGWVSELLPQPDRVDCAAEFQWSAERSFAVGSFDTPTERGDLEITDVGFEPDVVLFSVASGVATATGEGPGSSAVHGWTHGAYRRRREDDDIQYSLSLVAHAEGDEVAYDASDDAALDLAVPTTAGTLDDTFTGTVTDTSDDGFTVRFDAPPAALEGRYRVQYRAIRTGDESRVRVGHFTTDDREDPGTESVDLVDGSADDPGRSGGIGDLADMLGLGDREPSGLGDLGRSDLEGLDRAELANLDPQTIEDLESIGDLSSPLRSFDPDQLFLTATNVVPGLGSGDTTGTGAGPGGLVGFSHGRVVERDGTLSQHATTTAFDPGSGTQSVVGASDDAALDLLYGDDGVQEATRLRVSALGSGVDDGTVELEYQAPAADDVSFAGVPQLVTYVAIASPPADEPGETSNAPDAGAFPVPDADGDSVTVDVPFEPALVELTACPGATVDPSAAGDAVDVRDTVNAGGWSHGVATGSAGQQALGQVARSNLSGPGGATGTAGPGRPDATLGQGDNTTAVSLLSLDDDGESADRTVGAVASMDDGSFTVEFSTVTDGDERPVVFWTAWPTEPTERGFDAETVVSLADLDVGPLDAIALTQSSDQPGASQLERRIDYYAFRHRPRSAPPVPADARLELTFAEPGSDDPHAVSVAAYLEQARAIRDVVSEGRPADAADFAHPAEDAGPGYLSAGANPEGETASRLADRADAAQDLLRDAEAILDNRIALLDAPDDEPTILDRVDRLDDAVRSFGRAVPAGQIDVVADEADDWYDPPAGKSLLHELRALVPALRAGETDPDSADEALVVETGGPHAALQRVTVETDLSGGTEVDLTVAPLSEASRFEAVTKTTDTDDRGRVTVRFDASDVPPGTRIAVSVVVDGPSYPPLDVYLWDHLTDLSFDELEDLAQWVSESVFDERWLIPSFFPIWIVPWLEEEEHDRWPEADEWLFMDAEERREIFIELSREVKLEILSRFGAEEAVEYYRSGGSPTGLVAYEPGRVLPAAASDHADELGAVLADSELLGPLLWLATVHEDVDPDPEMPGGDLPDTPGAELAAALDPSEFDTGIVSTEKQLMGRLRGLSSPEAFSDADYDAVSRLQDLLSFDVGDLSTAMTAVVEPLEALGLTDLLTLSGDPARPDDQSFWRALTCAIGEHLDADCEGSVRARVRNFTRAPDDPVDDDARRYAPAFRWLVADTDVTLEHAAHFEALLADPSASVEAMTGVLDRPDRFLLALQDLLYHPEAVTEDVDLDDFVTEFDALVRELRSVSTRTRFDDAGVDLEYGDFVSFADGSAGDDFRDYVENVDDVPHVGRRSAAMTAFRNEFGGDLSTLASQTDTHVENRFAPAYATGDLSTPFRVGVLETLRRGLLRASYLGVYGSTPRSAAGGTDDDVETLVAQAIEIRDELRSRDDATGGMLAGDSVATQVDRIEMLFDDTVSVLPPFAPTNPGELSATLRASDDLVDDHYDVDTWLLRNGRLREHPRAFRQMRSYADHFAVTAPADATPSGGNGGPDLTRSLTVGQLPLRDPMTHSWVGSDEVTPRGDELSLVGSVVTNAGQTSDGEPNPVSATPGSPAVAGLYVDGWVEQVPRSERSLGVGIEYDDPDVRPPQSILLAVPPAWKRSDSAHFGPEWEPTTRQPWSMETLRTTLAETRDLVKMRGVDLDALDDSGHVLPALTLAFNEDTTVWNDEDTVYLPDAPSVDLDAFPWFELEDDR